MARDARSLRQFLQDSARRGSGPMPDTWALVHSLCWGGVVFKGILSFPVFGVGESGARGLQDGVVLDP